MTRRKMLWAALVAVPLAVTGGLVYAGTQKAGGYVCPATGETLPCPDCCPLKAAPATAAPAEGDRAKAEEGCVCPLTGETLGCPGCCPLNQKK